MARKSFLIAVLFCAVLFSGCATVGRYERVETLNIDGVRYVLISELCRKYNIEWGWDSFSGILTLKKASNEANILVGSRSAEIDGQKEPARYPFRFYKGRIVAPLDFQEELVKQWIGSRRIVKRKPVEYFGYKISKVVIDAGHGGKDPGAIGKSGTREKDITLDIARRLKTVLESKGVKIVMTRSSDKFIPLKDRASIANKTNADLFISIHVNANNSRQPYGFETYYFSQASDNVSRALEVSENTYYLEDDTTNNPSKNLKAILGDMIYTENVAASKEVAKHVCDNTCSIIGVKNRGIKSARFAVLRNTNIPAILVEVGFISNAKEEKYLKNSFYRQQIAEGLASSIANYRRVYRLTKK